MGRQRADEKATEQKQQMEKAYQAAPLLPATLLLAAIVELNLVVQTDLSTLAPQEVRNAFHNLFII